MGNVVDLGTARSEHRDRGIGDAHALHEVYRLREACRRLAAAIGDLDLDAGVQLGHEIDAAMIAGLEAVAARLES